MDTFMIVMLVFFPPILWIMVGAFASSAKLKKGRAFGLVIPEEEWKSSDVALIIHRCRVVLLWCGVILTLCVLSILWISDISVTITLWMVWLMLVILVPIVIYGRYFNCMKRLKKAKGWELSEEELHWYGGILYYNKNNPKIFVSMFPGVNSLNLAHLSGKILMALCGLCIAVLPFFGVAAIKADRTEMNVTATENSVIATHGKTEYTVVYDDVTEAVLLKEMPNNDRRYGYESTYLKIGTFTVDGYGQCSVCVDDRDEAILALETEETIYLISLDTEAEAMEIINNIKTE